MSFKQKAAKGRWRREKALIRHALSCHYSLTDTQINGVKVDAEIVSIAYDHQGPPLVTLRAVRGDTATVAFYWKR